MKTETNDKFNSLLSEKEDRTGKILFWAFISFTFVTISVPLFLIHMYYSSVLYGILLLPIVFLFIIIVLPTWIFSFTTLFIHLLLKKYIRYRARIIKVLTFHLTVLLFTFLFLSIADKTPLKMRYSSKIFSKEDWIEADTVEQANFESGIFYSLDEKYFLVIYYLWKGFVKEKICALYDSSNKLVDEIVPGTIDFKLIKWDKAEIIFSVYSNDQQELERLQANEKFGPYKVRYQSP